MHTLPRWLILFALVVSCGAHADTLADVKDRGQLRCGVNPSLPGFAQSDADGNWRGFDVDLCRAVASAVLGDADKVKFVPVPTEERFDVLNAGEVDLLARNTSWTLARDLGRGVDFVGVNYFDGQGFLVPRKLGLRSALELDGLRVCVQPGTTSAENLRRYFTRHLMDYTQVAVPSAEASVAALTAGDCDVITSDQSQLYALRSGLEDPTGAEVLPEIISKEPLGPVVREGDDRWADIVRWSLLVMIAAEEFDVSSRNIERVRSLAKSPELRSLLGLEGDFGARLELDNTWAFNIIEQVGNYGESFDRNLGSASPLNIGRGHNALWRDGGLLYAPPLL